MTAEVRSLPSPGNGPTSPPRGHSEGRAAHTCGEGDAAKSWQVQGGCGRSPGPGHQGAKRSLALLLPSAPAAEATESLCLLWRTDSPLTDPWGVKPTQPFSLVTSVCLEPFKIPVCFLLNRKQICSGCASIVCLLRQASARPKHRCREGVQARAGKVGATLGKKSVELQRPSSQGQEGGPTPQGLWPPWCSQEASWVTRTRCQLRDARRLETWQRLLL